MLNTIMKENKGKYTESDRVNFEKLEDHFSSYSRISSMFEEFKQSKDKFYSLISNLFHFLTNRVHGRAAKGCKRKLLCQIPQLFRRNFLQNYREWKGRCRTSRGNGGHPSQQWSQGYQDKNVVWCRAQQWWVFDGFPFPWPKIGGLNLHCACPLEALPCCLLLPWWDFCWPWYGENRKIHRTVRKSEF